MSKALHKEILENLNKRLQENAWKQFHAFSLGNEKLLTALRRQQEQINKSLRNLEV